MTEAWPEERIAALRGLVAQGLSASKIGRRMGVTRNTIIGKCHRLHLRLGAPPEKPVEAVPVPVPPKPRELSPPPPVARAVARAPVEALFSDVEPEPVEEAPAEGVLLLDLQRHHCRHIAGPTAGIDTRYCGAVRVPGSSYCPEHKEPMRGRGTPSERRVAELPRSGGFKGQTMITRVWK